jgi:hypothetical protein
MCLYEVCYLSRGRKMEVLSRHVERLTTSRRAGPAAASGESVRVTWWLLLSSSDLLCRGAGPDGRDRLLQSTEGVRGLTPVSYTQSL